MSRFVSNLPASRAWTSQMVKREVVSLAVEYERLVQDEFLKPKSGTVYGLEREVSFTANKGKKDRERQVKFIVNRGKTKQYEKFKAGQRKSKVRGVHQASAPGEAPAIQTGALRKGIARVVKQMSAMEWSAIVGVSIQSGRGGPAGKTGRSIAHDLEYGTTNMAPRPSWRPALKIIQERMSKRHTAKV